ncbi:unnamed protein product [Caenorhabditis brenneri]
MDNVVGERPPSKFSFGYVRLHWKYFLAGAIFIALLITAFFLILFLVILKPSSSPTPVASTVVPVVSMVTAAQTTQTVVASTVTNPLPTFPISTSTPVPSTTVTKASPVVSPTVAPIASTQSVLSTVNPTLAPTVQSTSTKSIGNSTTVSGSTQPMLSTQPSDPSTDMTSPALSTIPSTISMNITTTPGPTPDPNKVCATGFKLVNNKCWFLGPYTVYRDLGDSLCFNQAGSSLLSIKSAEENEKVAEFVAGQGIDKIWTGLKCFTNDTSSCVWDYGQGDVSGYSNFAVGSPNITIGTCVYYLVADKKWYSGVCDSDNWRYQMFCELPSTMRDTCKNNWNNNCYIENGQALFFSDAEDYCKQQCGTLLSIHTPLENRYVSSIYQLYYESRGGSLILGCVAPSQDMIIYNDYTPINTYNNLKNFTIDQNCVFFDIPSNAEEECRSYNGATLVKVDSIVKLKGIQQYLGDMLYRETWIGLYCNGTQPTDCYWTHDRGILDFDVFGKWSPNATTGNCVVMNVKDGSWSSRDCNQRTDSFCELPATTQDDCANNYDHHCYSLNQTSLSFADAQRTCQQSCGNLVSIHSELENRYVTSIISSESGTVSLGGVAPSSRTILWSDSSMQAYNNINQYGHEAKTNPVDNNENNEREATIVEISTEPKTEFEPVEKQRHFGILHYAVTKRFRRIMIIGLINAILVITFFVSVILFLEFHKTNKDNVSPTTSTSTTPVTTANEGYCNANYAKVNYKCWRLVTLFDDHTESERTCTSDGGYLAVIHTEEDHNSLMNFVNESRSIKKIWLGLSCIADDIEQCVWDDTIRMGRTSFNNFADGHPDTTNGMCVKYSLIDSKWHSSTCSETASFVCELPMSHGDPDGCENILGDYCYSLNEPAIFTEASRKCKKWCGELASVHSEVENQWIKTMISLSNEPIYTLGGYASSTDSLVWIDGSPMDYSCCKWYCTWQLEHPSTQSAHFVCKKKLEASCTPTQAPLVSLAPILKSSCNGIMTGDGWFSFPNYPQPYPANSVCKLKLITYGPQSLELNFHHVSLGDDKVYVYDGESEKDKLVRTVTGGNTVFHYAAGNVIFVSFEAGTNDEHNSGFNATFWTIF